MRRRELLYFTASASAFFFARPARALESVKFELSPFTLGVASGYPRPDGFSLWTRLAPKPLSPRGGLPFDLHREVIAVRWEVSESDNFSKIAASGTAFAEPEWAHSIHVDVFGLKPARRYFYRFRAGDAMSSTGRTLTAPAATATVDQMRIALASCSHYEQGYFANYRAMADDDCDLILHVGDYIYESSWGENRVRSHGDPEPMTLEDYRIRHALYRTDADLQLAHAACPWLLTWDDHEVDNDYAKNLSEDNDLLELFKARRAAAYQAYYEHMPLPRSMVPMGSYMRIYNRLQYGSLADFFVLDDRQYRSAHPCPPAGERGSTNVDERCTDRFDESLTLLGAQQESWLAAKLSQSTCQWNLMVQQTLMVQKDSKVGKGVEVNTDGWDGYPAARARLIKQLANKQNPIVLGGDVHCHYVANVLEDQNPNGKIIASEFCGTSITSQAWPNDKIQAELADNPHILLGNSAHRGYVRLDINQKQAQADLRIAADVRTLDSEISTLASFIVEPGRPGPVKA
jgi:alkaline phosphatase D